METVGQGRVRVWTNSGAIEAARVVITAGHHSTRLLRRLGIGLPIRPAKGYSITVDVPDERMRPRIAVIDDAMHAAVVPLGTRLRVAGTAEFAGDDRTLQSDRVANLFTLLDALYPDVARSIDKNGADSWTGLRPMSADGLPFIGPTKAPGVYVNAGHGHLGWTLAAGAARVLADVMLGKQTDIDSNPYRATR
jgi:D-amino-acid dehydrogenase